MTNQLVDEYSDLVIGVGVIEQEKQALIDSVLTPEIKAKIAEIDAEYAPKLEALNYNKAQYETKLKALVLEAGETIKGQYHAFTWTKGRTSWDTDALDRYAKDHPEVAYFKTMGKPSVSVRKV